MKEDLLVGRDSVEPEMIHLAASLSVALPQLLK